MKKVLKRMLAFVYRLPLGRRRTLSLFLSDDALNLLKFEKEGYLLESGWFNSLKLGTPVDRCGAPLPWFTYPLLEFIEKRLTEDMVLFEFGAGNSTLFFERKVKRVTSVEHDKDWFNKIDKLVSRRVNLQWVELDYDGSYCRKANMTEERYDILIVDGRDRVNCCIQSITALKDSGVIILDDSDRERYSAAKYFLKQNNFKQLDFWGISPGNFNRRCSSIFYRENNCLNI